MFYNFLKKVVLRCTCCSVFIMPTTDDKPRQYQARLNIAEARRRKVIAKEEGRRPTGTTEDYFFYVVIVVLTV